jgi:probable HAF family extracellular repeat protein
MFPGPEAGPHRWEDAAVALLNRSRVARLAALTLLPVVGLACANGGASPSPAGSAASGSPTTAPTGMSPTATPTATAAPTATLAPTASATPVITPTHAPVGYTLIDLGVVGYGAESGWIGINASNVAAGSNFRYSGGAKTTIKPAPGQTSVDVLSINSGGTIAGRGCATNCHATRWSDPLTGRDLGTLGGSNSMAYQISDGGIVVGFSDTAGNTTTHAFRQSGVAAMVDLNTLVVSGPVFKLREAWGINSSGTIVGWAGANGAPHAFMLTAGGVLSEIGPLPGMTTGEARAINNAGHVAGFSGDGVHIVGFLYSGTSLKAIPKLTGYELTHPYAINGSDVVVGCGRKLEDDSQVHAFRYSGGSVVDLNSFLPGGSSWTLECATGINNGGTIVGTGRKGAVNHLFMLVPA